VLNQIMGIKKRRLPHRNRLASFVLLKPLSSSGGYMSTISSVTNPAAGYVAPIAVDNPTVAGSFNQNLAVAKAPKTWLTNAEASIASRPNVKEFMDRAGAQFMDASELIYGVIGSNKDVRDWTAIMASEDPITAARQATSQMYGRTDITPRPNVTYLSASDTVAKEGNFAVRLLKDKEDKVVDQGLKVIDAQGLLLRDAGSTPETIVRNAWLFGFDTQPLVKLVVSAATVSVNLGQAVRQASTMASSNEALSSMSVSNMATESASLLGLAGIAVSSRPPVQAQPSFQENAKAQVDDQATSPSLRKVIEQATEQAAASAFSFVDSSTYLGSLFKG
jgi:hypothetical protein